MTPSRLALKSDYSIGDLAEMIHEVHSCVHRAAEATEKVAEELQGHRTEMATQLGQVRERVAKLEGRSEAIGQRVGVDERADTQKAVWFPKPWQMFGAVCVGVGGFVALYQIAIPVLSALNHALLTHH